MGSIDIYRQISKNYNDSITRGISRKIVIAENQVPKTLGIWGRLIRYFSSLRMSDDQLRNTREKTINNFKEAISQVYSQQARADAFKIVDEVAKNNRSLHARDVYKALDVADISQNAFEKAENIDVENRQKISKQMVKLLGEGLTKICHAYLAMPEIKNIAPGVSLTPDENTALLVCTGAVSGVYINLNKINLEDKRIKENLGERNSAKPLIRSLEHALVKIGFSKLDYNQSEEFICVAKNTKKGYSDEDTLRKVPTLNSLEYQVLEIYKSDTEHRYKIDRQTPGKTIYKYKTVSGRAVNIPQIHGPAKRFLILSPDSSYTTSTTIFGVGQDEQNTSPLLRTPENADKGAIICDMTEQNTTIIL